MEAVLARTWSGLGAPGLDVAKKWLRDVARPDGGGVDGTASAVAEHRTTTVVPITPKPIDSSRTFQTV